MQRVNQRLGCTWHERHNIPADFCTW